MGTKFTRVIAALALPNLTDWETGFLRDIKSRLQSGRSLSTHMQLKLTEIETKRGGDEADLSARNSGVLKRVARIGQHIKAGCYELAFEESATLMANLVIVGDKAIEASSDLPSPKARVEKALQFPDLDEDERTFLTTTKTDGTLTILNLEKLAAIEDKRMAPKRDPLEEATRAMIESDVGFSLSAALDDPGVSEDFKIKCRAYIDAEAEVRALLNLPIRA